MEVTTPVSVAFDEKMDKRSAEAGFYLTPRTDLESINWEGSVMTVTPAQGLIEDRTYTVLLRAGLKDRRGNGMRDPVVAHFSTGDYVAPGVIEGEVETGRARAPGAMVWAYGSEHCPPSFGESPPAGVGQTRGDGRFTIGGLEVGVSYCVYGHLDKDGDGALDEADLFVGADSLIHIDSDSARVSGVTIYLVPDDEPGSITGAVIDSVGPPFDIEVEAAPLDSEEGAAEPDSVGALAEPDSVGAPAAPDSAAAAAAETDSTALARSKANERYLAAKMVVVATDLADSSNFTQAEVGAGGSFNLKGLRPGAYRVEAFRDLNGDKKMALGVEPSAALKSVVVNPGRVAEVGTLILRLRPAVVK